MPNYQSLLGLENLDGSGLIAFAFAEDLNTLIEVLTKLHGFVQLDRNFQKLDLINGIT